MPSYSQSAMNRATRGRPDAYKWLEEIVDTGQDELFGKLASGLALLRRNVQTEFVFTGQRPFPYASVQGEELLAILKPVPIDEFTRQIAPRMLHLNSLEHDPKVMPDRRHHCRDEHRIAFEADAALKDQFFQVPERTRHPQPFGHLACRLGPLGAALRVLDKVEVEPEFGNLLFEAPEGVTVIGHSLDPVVRCHFGEGLRHMAKADVLAGRCVQKSICDPEVVGLLVPQDPRRQRIARRPDLDPGIKARFAVLFAIALDSCECGQVAVRRTGRLQRSNPAVPEQQEPAAAEPEAAEQTPIANKAGASVRTKAA